MIAKREITDADANKLVAQEEDHFFEHKAFRVSGKRLQKNAVAFANADGGEIFIGIADPKDQPDINLRWSGPNRIEDFNGVLQALNEINPGLTIQYEFLTAPSKVGYVLHVEIEKSGVIHRTADNTVYVRLGAQNLPVQEPARIQELEFAKGIVSFEDQLVKDTRPEDVTETAEIGRFLDAYSPKTDPLDYAVMQNLLDRASWQPRVCGLLLFSGNPQALIPRKCAVKIARYETKEDDPERDHLGNTITVDGPLYYQIHETVNAVAKIMSSISIWTTTGLNVVEYPPEAIWEIIVNAIIHRDYSISDDIQVLIFDNRVEVLSPGRLPSFVTPENILDTRYARNPKLVRTLNRYADAPNKDLGEGLNTAFEKMKQFRLQPPIITQDATGVRVTIPHIPLARPTELILEFLRTHDRIANKQARDLTGIKSENSVKNEFYKLRDDGMLEMIEGLKGSLTAWQLTDRGRKHLSGNAPKD